MTTGGRRSRGTRCLAVAAAALTIVAGACSTSASPSAGTASAELSPTAASAVPSAAASASAAPSPSATDSPLAARIAAATGRILFTVESNGTTSLVSIRPDGSDRQVLVEASATANIRPVWVPGLQSILFESDRAGEPRVYSMDVATGATTAIGPANLSQSMSPGVSADGEMVAFDTAEQDATSPVGYRDEGIHVAAIDGTGAKAVTHLDKPKIGYDTSATFSPDGNSIAFIRNTDATAPGAIKGALFVTGMAGGPVRQLTSFDVDAGRPRWSPDGTRILFADNYDAGAGASSNLWVVNPDGTGLTQLTHNTHGATNKDGDWSPDGSLIVANFFHPGLGGPGTQGLEILDQTGADPTVIWTATENGESGETPDWAAP